MVCVLFCYGMVCPSTTDGGGVGLSNPTSATKRKPPGWVLFFWLPSSTGEVGASRVLRELRKSFVSI